ncbi:vesicle coat component [Rhizopus stolonifer]|uniref:COPII coat assembly protein SEC16 n=1 Tax=Rhizopus stolonifer TaxID=4846 RepID=A0A367KW18_RHIST|nr:vesicle coat component [Rhizopus stolonifer]
MTSRSEETKGSIPFGEPAENDPFSQIQQPSSNETPSKDVADASVLFGSNDASADFFSSTQPPNASAANFFEQQQTPSETFFDHLGPNVPTKSQENVPQSASLAQTYEPAQNYNQQGPEEYTTEQSNVQWQQFDPNVHYYYDEQNQVHYYDPNTNQEYDMSQYGYDYQYDPQYYTQEGYDPNAYVSQDQSTQQAYDPNAYAINNEPQQTYSLGQESYGTDAYANPAGNGQQENYDPSVYASSLAVVPENSTQYAPVQESYDLNAYTVNSAAISAANGQQEQTSFAQDNYNPDLYTANSKDNQQQTTQDNYDPKTYATNSAEQHQEQQQQQDYSAQNSYNLSANHSFVEHPNDKNQQQQEHVPIQDNYEPNAYMAHSTGYEQPGQQYPSQQDNYDPNAYMAHQSGYEQQYTSEQDNYDPNAYTAHPTGYDQPNQQNQEHQEHAPVQDSYDQNAYNVPNYQQPSHQKQEQDYNLQTVDPAVFSVDNGQQSSKQLSTSTQDVFESNFFEFNQANNQEPDHTIQENKQETDQETTHAAVIPADDQTPSYEQPRKDSYNPDMYAAKNFNQQDDLFENLQSLENVQDNNESPSDVLFNVSSDQNSTAVLDLNTDELSNLADNTTQQNSGHEKVLQPSYVPDLYSTEYQKETQQKDFASEEPPVDVEYFNYQEQPYSSSSVGISVHSTNAEQHELGAETPTATVDLNSAPFIKPSTQQESESQFAEVQLAPVSSYTENNSITAPSNIISAYDRVKSPDYSTPEQLNSYEPLGQMNQFEEVQFAPNVYAPTPPPPATTTRAMSPHRVSSPFGSVAPPERILSPLGRSSIDHASARSSLEMKGSFIDRVGSPVVPLVPCPDPQCEGENKPKAKFCCECGRPLAGLSRSNTPFSGTNTPFATFSSVSETQKNLLGDKRASMVESLKSFRHSVLFDTNMTQDEKKTALVSYIDGRLNEFSDKEDGRYLLWKVVRVFVEANGALGESEQVNQSIIELLGPTKEASGSTVLDQLEDFLLKGDREGACHFAMDHDLWDHALIISQSTQGDLYKRVVDRFMEHTLSSAGQLTAQATDDKKSLRILYSLFSGADIVSQLANKDTYTKESLADWKLALSLALANPSIHDGEAIHSLGDALKQCELEDESRICYLLSPKISVLAGLDASIINVTFTDLDLFYIMDLYDFAVKGDAASVQIFKFVHAWWLADLGFEEESQHYRESIANTIGSNNHQPFIEKFKHVSQQLLESPSDNVASLLNKSTFDKLIDALEEKFKASTYGGYGYGMNNDHYQTSTNTYSYGQDTNYAATEPSYNFPDQSNTVDQGAYSYGYGYTPETNTGYTPEANTGYTPETSTGYEPVSTNSYNPVDTAYQPSEANVPPAYQNKTEETKTSTFLDDDADLGFGNSSFQKKKGVDEKPIEEKKEETEKEERKSEKSGGWGIFSMFSRKETPVADEKKAVKANLGQENSFYYDEKEKRWVNKLNDTQPVAATPPPPPKSMTPQPSSVQSPPPSLGSKPSSVPPRVNSAPVGSPFGSPNGTPPGFSTPPMTGGSKRPGAGSKKKPMRSRYVDVFNPPN